MNLKNAAGSEKVSWNNVRTWSWGQRMGARRYQSCHDDLPCPGLIRAETRKSRTNCHPQERQISTQLQHTFFFPYFSGSRSWLSFDVSSWENIFIKQNQKRISLGIPVGAMFLISANVFLASCENAFNYNWLGIVIPKLYETKIHRVTIWYRNLAKDDVSCPSETSLME